MGMAGEQFWSCGYLEDAMNETPVLRFKNCQTPACRLPADLPLRSGQEPELPTRTVEGSDVQGLLISAVPIMHLPLSLPSPMYSYHGIIYK